MITPFYNNSNRHFAFSTFCTKEFYRFMQRDDFDGKCDFCIDKKIYYDIMYVNKIYNLVMKIP